MNICEYCGAHLDAGEKCDCQVHLEIEEYNPISEIKFNKDELIKRLSNELAEYKGIVVTSENMVEMKKKKAELNKLKTAINDEKIRQKKIFSEPITAFEKEVKEILTIIESVTNNIDKQIKEYEKAETDKKIEKLREYYNNTVGGLSEVLTFESIYTERWELKGETLEKCQKSIDDKLFKVRKEISTVEKLCGDFILECKAEYFKEFSLAAALEKAEELKRVVALQKARELDKQEESPKAETAPTETVENERIWEVHFIVSGTKITLNKLKTYMDLNGVKYEVLKGE